MSDAPRLSFSAETALGDFTLDAAFEAPLSGTTALFGPSGSGKTTILRILAGLTTPDAGQIRLGAQTWLDTSKGQNLPPHRRPAGLVFQDTRLFDHLTAAQNLAFAAKRAGATAAKTAEVTEALDLAPLLTRHPKALSGGEAQRVALGRTLLSQPKLLLLDEPMSGLDARRKSQIMPYLARLSETFGIPTLLVSHAVEEVAQLASQTIVLNKGRVAATGPTDEILASPELQNLTGRFEAGALVTATVAGHDRALHLTRLTLGDEALIMPMLESLPPGSRIRLRIRARDVALATERPRAISIRNCLKATVTAIAAEPDTAFAEVTLIAAGQPIRARITRASVADLGLATGSEAYALIKSVTFDRRGMASRV